MRFLIFLVCIQTISLFVHSQEPNFTNYGVEDGLLSSECYQVLQDKQGYIWIATDKGVNRFDSYKFQSYTKENGLPENCVLRMYLDSRGRIWFVCLSGKMAIYENGKVRPLPINSEIAQKINGGIINSMQMSQDTLRMGYFCSNKSLQIVYRGGKFKLIPDLSRFKSGAYIDVFPDKSTLFGWVVLSRKEKSPKNLTVFHRKGRRTIHNFFDDVINYWFQAYCFQNRMYVINNQYLTIVSLQDYSIERKKFDSHILAFKLESSGQSYSIWVGTMKGLCHFTDSRFAERPGYYLKDKAISYLFRDKEGGFWVSTLNKGIFYAKNMRIQNFLEGRKVYTMIQAQNKLYLGLENGRIGIFDGKKIREYKSLKNTSGFPVKKMFQIDSDHLLVRHRRTSVFSLKTKKITKTLDLSNPNDFIYDSITRKGLIFDESVILEYTEDSDRLKWLSKEYNIKINCASVRKHNGKVLLGTNLGLAEYDESGQKLRFLDKGAGNVLDLVQSDSEVWLATKEDGIQVRHHGKVYKITSKTGLTSDYCCHIFLEDRSNAWISTNKGLTCIRIQSWSPFKYECSQFSRKDGLISDEVSQICKWNNQIVVASAGGLSILDKSNMFMPEYKPQVYVSELNINGKKYPIKNDYKFQKAIKNVVINFKGLCFRKEGALLYRYRFREIDTTWRLTTNTSIEYNELPYGKMTFEIQAQSTDGNWNTPIRKVVLFSPTPFFETTWFLMSFIVIVGLIIWVFVYWRVYLIKKRAFEREKLYRKASEMELKFLTGQMNPHFTFNAMNSVQQFMLGNDLLKAQNYLTKYSKLIRKVLENNMHEYVSLASELELSKLYIEIESMRFSKKIDFQIECDAELMNTCHIPPMLIQPYLENAIWHGLFDDAVENGSIGLILNPEKESVKCIIEDNGIGREQSQLKKGRKGEQHSLGMLITRKRLDHLTESNYIEPEIVDLYDETGNSCGTRVILYLPCIRK